MRSVNNCKWLLGYELCGFVVNFIKVWLYLIHHCHPGVTEMRACPLQSPWKGKILVGRRRSSGPGEIFSDKDNIFDKDKDNMLGKYKDNILDKNMDNILDKIKGILLKFDSRT